MPPAPRRGGTRGRVRRKARKNIAIGQAHIKTSFNNTIVALTDPEGNVIVWESAGSAGFKGSRKSTPFAAQVTADSCARKGMEHGLQKVEVFVKGPGSGRETAIRSLQAAGLEIGLTYIYGIGQSTAKRICAETGLSPDEKVKDLTDDEVTKLREYIDGNLQVEGDLRRERQQAIKRLQEIGAYRGLRHRRGLPVHGQRTKTNARTRKGPKKTVGRGKKAAAK